MRLASYFSFVSDEDHKKGWNDYLNSLSHLRDDTRVKINENEQKLRDLQNFTDSKDVAKIDEIRRNLTWWYGENSATQNPNEALFPTLEPQVLLIRLLIGQTLFSRPRVI